MLDPEALIIEDFTRLRRLPPYILSVINTKKMEIRRRGEDVIDLGMGNPNIPAPDEVVNKLKEVVSDPKSHRYSAAGGIFRLKEEIAKRYSKIWNVSLDPETEVAIVSGTKMGFFQLTLAMVSNGDNVIVPEPAYPVHLYAPIIAGADVRTFSMFNGLDFFENLQKIIKTTYPKPKFIVVSFPNNPTTKCVDIGFFEKLIEFAISERIWIVHDFAYADIVFDGYRAPSILQVKDAKKVAVEFYSMSKGFCMAGFRIGFAVGNKTLVGILHKIKSWMEYGLFTPVQVAAIVALRDFPDYPEKVAKIYESRRNTVVEWLRKMGWEVEKPQGSMFVWAKIPEDFRKSGSEKFASWLLEKSYVATAPGIAFGQSGEGFIRIALVENEQRIKQAVRNIRKAMNSAY
ncbi:MAG: aminotransferase class I/II-fold pyridoxal phosphate-dependent enzyme [Candidatus Calescibacterium sp.]|nr:aminotransferase class I/II-fold pyridoxal phosphate-dependent enzyme [Candidatus Calescibacterium sp.]MCX7734976.1 aminotransferase class I/II-fold pyridoxal phosphate-dependent enzyme [bacterium]MDW8088108.1 aminotransferase class I/II-fold pyridoxal phosphate-dependent enzyme [Candidatus Calescibacterium sp.]